MTDQTPAPDPAPMSTPPLEDWDRLAAALDRVRELHRPVEGLGWKPDGGYGTVPQACSSCGVSDEYAVPWPCPTIRTLDGSEPAETPEEGPH